MYILNPTVRKNEIELEFDELIQDFIETCRDHQSITRPRVLKWIQQFDNQSLDIPRKILSELRYYSSTTLTGMTNEFVDLVYQRLNCNRSDLFFVPIGGAGSGAQNIARVIRTHPNVNARNVIDLFELNSTRFDDAYGKYIIFFDDFSGSGKTIREWWDRNEPLILPFNATIGLGVVLINYMAEEEIMKLDQIYFFVEYLNERFNIFNDHCEIFSNTEQDKILSYCTKTRCSSEYLRGYGNCGLLISFQHGCPNNSLPILWYDRTDWLNLFHRRSI